MGLCQADIYCLLTCEDRLNSVVLFPYALLVFLAHICILIMSSSFNLITVSEVPEKMQLERKALFFIFFGGEDKAQMYLLGNIESTVQCSVWSRC